MEQDWHDWDVSNAPALITTRGGRQLVTFAPKDGHLYLRPHQQENACTAIR
ncbi:MAG: hypothetical protein U1F20_06275 [Lysobacterales bacterium]